MFPRFHEDTPEFGRVVNLSDGVFAIALTLLVLTLDVPAVPASELAGALLAEVPQVLMFALSFFLVAGIWWMHHRLVAQLAAFDSALMAMNLALLGLVALIPFPTSLVGHAPTARAAVLPFMAVFLGISALFLLMLLRAHATGIWRRPPPEGLFRWIVLGWCGQVAGVVAAMLLALLAPLAGLVLMALLGTIIAMALALVAPPAYRRWLDRPGF